MTNAQPRDRESLRETRHFSFERAAVDEEARTVELSFSSEDPYERYFGMEVLGHRTDECDMVWMMSGNAPLLMDHNTRDLVGVVQRAWIEGARGKAVVRFSQSERAAEVFREVLDGTRRNVSVGYEVRKMVLIEEKDDMATYRVVDWMPLEISLVAVPADMTVGVGRSKAEQIAWMRSMGIIQPKEMTMTTEITPTPAPAASQMAAELDAAMKMERERVKEIMALARTFNMAEQGEAWCQEGLSLDEVRKAILAKMPKTVNATGDLAAPAVITERAGFRSLGEQLLAVRAAKLRPHAIDRRLIEVRASGLGAFEGSDQDGGFLVQQDFSQEIIRRMNDVGQIIGRVRRLPISGNANGTKIPAINETSRVTGSRWGGVQAFWVPEGGALTQSRPKFRMIQLTLGKLAALMYATDELLQDAAQLEAIAMQAFPEEMLFMTEDAIMNGDGAGKPLGFLNGPAVVNVAIEGTQTIANTATFLAINVANMMSRMPARNYANAVWLINPVLLAKLVVMTIGGSGGATPVYLPGGNLSGEPFGTLLGRPVIPVEYCAAEGTPGDIVLADMSQYVLADKGGIDAATSMHVAFLTDEMAFRFIYRVDGQPVWNNVLTPFKGSATQAPFITLATRS